METLTLTRSGNGAEMGYCYYYAEGENFALLHHFTGKDEPFFYDHREDKLMLKRITRIASIHNCTVKIVES